MTRTELIEALTKAEAGSRELDAHLWILRRAVLEKLDVYRDEFCFLSFRHFEFPREITRGLLRDLTDMGLTQYKNGLWTEDGEMYGAGYGLTDEGRALLRALEAKEAG